MPVTGAQPARRRPDPALTVLTALTGLTALSDDQLRARLWRAAEARMNASTTRAHDHAGRVCLQVIDELTRRRVPLWGTTGDHRLTARARRPRADPARTGRRHAPGEEDLDT